MSSRRRSRGVVRLVVAARAKCSPPASRCSISSHASSARTMPRDETPPDLDAIRPDLAEVIARHALTRRCGARRSRRQAARAGRPHRARQCRGSVRPRQLHRIRRADHRGAAQPPLMDDLLRNTPADGVITGLGTINASLVRRGARRRRGHRLRLHRARRHAGHDEPQEAGPPVSPAPTSCAGRW